MSPRHAKPKTALRRACITGAVGAATVGAATAALALAGPAESPVGLRHAAAVSAATAPILAEQAVLPPTDTAAYLQVRDVDTVKTKRVPTADDAVRLATSQVGVTEKPAGGTKYNQWFMSSPLARRGVQRDGGKISDYANADWCDMFVSWVGDTLGVKGFGGDAYVPAHAAWFKNQSRWGQVPRVGAVVFFSWGDGGLDHIGLVIKDNHNGTIQTVEGNTDNAVKIRTRPTTNVVGYGYPQYAEPT